MNILKNQLDSLYTSSMNCTNTEKECKGILKRKGIPPRGFFYKSAPIDVLIVSKNPGHPLKKEQPKYKVRTGAELYQAYRNHQKEIYYNLEQTKDPNLRFHKNMFSYVSTIFNIPNDVDIIYQQVAHTALVKCSTKGESIGLHNSAMEECYQKYFKDELKLLKPKVLLALGREVEKFLISVCP
jgi:uracil-DNA glycosylase